MKLVVAGPLLQSIKTESIIKWTTNEPLMNQIRMFNTAIAQIQQMWTFHWKRIYKQNKSRKKIQFVESWCKWTKIQEHGAGLVSSVHHMPLVAVNLKRNFSVTFEQSFNICDDVTMSDTTLFSCVALINFKTTLQHNNYKRISSKFDA
jgi:methionine aminopeptidase